MSGWNRPKESKADKGSGAKRETRLWAWMALVTLFVAVLASTAWFVLSSGRSSDKTADRAKKSSLIAEQTPATVRPQTNATVTSTKERKPQRVGEVRDGYRLLPNGRLHKVNGVVTSRVAKVTLADKLFEQSADHSIATLILAKPGDGLLGDSSEYYKNFPKLFKEALKTPIVIEKDDTEEAKELKQAVIDARKELKDRMDAGEDLTAVMRESRDQLRELALYRDDLDKQVREILSNKDNITKKDVNDLVSAANQMLKERGIKPLVITTGLAHHLRQRQLKKERLSERKNSEKEINK